MQKENIMNRITLKNFRCFREKQTARLAPLTLLVGENSTGKTSFMAMLRALWNMVCLGEFPDFKEAPYDLGSFDEIANFRGGRSGRASTIEAGFEVVPTTKSKRGAQITTEKFHFEVAFEKEGTVPALVRRRFSQKDVWVELSQSVIHFETPRGKWKREYENGFISVTTGTGIPLPFLVSHLMSEKEQWTVLSGPEQPVDEDLVQIREIISFLFEHFRLQSKWPYASAPVRSKPRRTYDPARPTQDPEGNYIPMYLSNLYFQSKNKWEQLKQALENFGQSAGLFDEISVRPLGKKGTEPFQMQVRKFGKGIKGPQRNLIDVGYGVSQVLPVVTELLRPDAPSMFLLQQPEVHLHPSAQAALGSLFCQVAEPQRQLVVETHSDHLINRVRMDVRDGDGKLKPEDVSILFFERRDLDVHIHSLEIDAEGNILNAPPVYRQFFINEMERSIWKKRKSKGS